MGSSEQLVLTNQPSVARMRCSTHCGTDASYVGIRAASVLAAVQLFPSAILASPAATWLHRFPRARALTLGYALQALAMGAICLALAVGSPPALVIALAALGRSR